MKWLREDHGYIPWKVEVFLSFIKQRRDMYNFADIVAIRKDRQGVLAVQTTRKAFLDEHRKMFRQNKYAKVWLFGGNRIWLIGWDMFWNAKGTRKIWAPVVEEVALGKDSKRVIFREVEELRNAN